eukprot:TRINITY_DN26631_c0_g1_i1.p1 TRINITY_DN26631_c0_g1~~TRINITY_DN26631_c0_g1_i1.p1  ORF type:complete len:296 (+),score=56.62 TRINITY_DN26631_c0_g1_i1:120-1007(+)
MKLPTGKVIPQVGFGVGTRWFNRAGGTELNAALVSAIKSALKVGYRHIDAAEVYNTESEVGVAIKEAGIPREELFITTKVIRNIKDIRTNLRDSLARLGLEYVDLYLIHAPFFSPETHGISISEAWKVMEELLAAGLTKGIGVSNFQIPHLQEILASGSVKPFANQIEFHPYLQQEELLKFCAENDILVESYGGLTPMRFNAGGPVDAAVEELTEKYKKTASQILLRWALEKGVVSITTSSDSGRQAEMFSVTDFSLAAEDVAKIDNAGKQVRFRKFWTSEFDKLEAKERTKASA